MTLPAKTTPPAPPASVPQVILCKPADAESLPSAPAYTCAYKHDVIAELSMLVGKTQANITLFRESLTTLKNSANDAINPDSIDYVKYIYTAWTRYLDAQLIAIGEVRWSLMECWQRFRAAQLARMEVGYVDGGGIASGQVDGGEIASRERARTVEPENGWAKSVSTPKVSRKSDREGRGILRNSGASASARRSAQGGGGRSRPGRNRANLRPDLKG